MKHVNLSPDLEKKKAEIMKQFRKDDDPPASQSAPPAPQSAPPVPQSAPPAPESTSPMPVPGVRVMPPAEPGTPPAEPGTPPAEPSPAPVESGTTPSAEALQTRVIESLKTIYDPEIPVNIYDLGLIYRVEITNGFAEVDMTLTTPGCPVAQTFPGMVEGAVRRVPGITGATVELVWEPPWSQSLISEAARLELGLI